MVLLCLLITIITFRVFTINPSNFISSIPDYSTSLSTQVEISKTSTIISIVSVESSNVSSKKLISSSKKTESRNSPSVTTHSSSSVISCTINFANYSWEWHQYDSEVASIVKVIHPQVDGYYYALIKITYQDDQNSGGNHNIYFRVMDENYMLQNGILRVSYSNEYTDTSKDFPMYAGLNSYSAKILSSIPSDTVTGMGLPGHHHVNYILDFQKMNARKCNT